MSSNVSTDSVGNLVSADEVTHLLPGEIFVFGSNAKGKHGSGAARAATNYFGAVYGQGHGLYGSSYAIDTMSGASVLGAEIARFLSYATAHSELTFLVTKIGCGVAGYSPAQLAPYFAASPGNVALPESFVAAGAKSQVSDPATRPSTTSGAASTTPPVQASQIADLPGMPVVRHQARPGRSPGTPALSAIQLDRAVGVIVASAAGDALGAPYEFGGAHPDGFTPDFGIGVFGHARGEWTDDTSMAIPILEASATGRSLRDVGVLGDIVERWVDWSKTAKDVGSQTRAVFVAVGAEPTEQAALNAACDFHTWTGRSAGNGALMRTGPVALAYLRPGSERRVVEAAGRIARLTHWEEDNVDAVVLWSLMVRHAILTGELQPGVGIPFLPSQHQSRWSSLIEQAMAEGSHPRDFREKNGWVVKAFQGALSAVAGAPNVRQALYRAVRGGGDTDTVAAIAGALAGALWGASQVPLAWQRVLHGWPGYNTNDLTRLAVLAARRGETDGVGWPSAKTIPTGHFFHTAPRRHPHDNGVWLGSQSALAGLPASIDAVVSLCRVGTGEIPDGIESVRVWLIDKPGQNANLDWTLSDAADTIADLRREGKEVFVHCAEARSRTATVAALYSMRHKDVPPDQAWADVSGALPHFSPASFHRDAVDRIMGMK